jgi:hypothetical protein
VQVAVEPASKEAAVKLLMEVPPEPSKQGLRQAVAVHRMLEEQLQHPEAAAEFKALCSKVRGAPGPPPPGGHQRPVC